MDLNEGFRRTIARSDAGAQILDVQTQLVNIEEDLNQAREKGQVVSALLARRVNLNERLIHLRERRSREESADSAPPPQPQPARDENQVRRSLRLRRTAANPPQTLPPQPQPTRHEELFTRPLRWRTKNAFNNFDNDEDPAPSPRGPRASGRRRDDGEPEVEALRAQIHLELQENEATMADRARNPFGNPTVHAGAEDKQAVLSECLSCGERLGARPFVHLVCGHYYCPDCLQRLFAIACKDEQSFPARCCPFPIPVEHVETLLTPEIKSEYAAKEIEFRTQNRTYVG